MANVYINKKEREALLNGSEQVRNVLESCSAEEGSWVVKMLQDTIVNLDSILEKTNKN